MSKAEIAKAIKEAFEEGWCAPETPANYYNTLEDAWEESDAKALHDKLLGI